MHGGDGVTLLGHDGAAVPVARLRPKALDVL
jgi:hypothetical protein